jgi:cation diffusion facilitator CzcD-associated flavoprotein CzcO
VIGCRWLLCAAGYYRYDQGFVPRFAGRERFGGPVIHPQHWPHDLDYAGKQVVVIGSGATAVTLVPAMARRGGTGKPAAAHVTMLQRTPSYIMPVATRDKLNARLTALLGPDRAFAITRRINIFRQVAFWRLCQRYPGAARKIIRDINARMLPAGYPVEEHFNPPYRPWDQRVCIVPDGDLFRAIRRGTASVVTGHIETFTEHGVLLTDGREIPADLIVTATGLNVRALGGIALSVDGMPVSVPDSFVYKGVLLSGVPNFAFVFGYTNASWTLKVGLIGEYLSRLLSYMDSRGYAAVRPVADPAMPARPFTDFAAGYITRSLGQLPRQGARAPWRLSPTYNADVRLLRRRRVADRELIFTAAKGPGERSQRRPFR